MSVEGWRLAMDDQAVDGGHEGTMFLDFATHTVYLVSGKLGAQPAPSSAKYEHLRLNCQTVSLCLFI